MPAAGVCGPMTPITWEGMYAVEWYICALERQKRNQLAVAKDLRLSGAPSPNAPYFHENDELKYYALLTRALEHAKLNE